MKINKLNYETYVIDYLEGTLSAADRAAFESYLLEHPEVKEEIADYLAAPIIDEDILITYEGKKQTKKKRRGLVWLISLAILVALAAWIAVPMITEDASQEIEEKESVISPAAPLSPMMAEVDSSNELIKIEHSPMASEQGMAETPQQSKSTITPQSANNTHSEALAAVLETVTDAVETEGKLKENGTEDSRRVESRELYPITTQKKAQQEILAATAVNAMQMEDKVDAKLRVTPIAKSSVTEVVSPQLEPLAVLINEYSVDELNEPRLIEIVVVTKINDNTKKKKSGWRKIFTPQSYDDINLGRALTSQNLKSAVEDVHKRVVPETLLTK